MQTISISSRISTTSATLSVRFARLLPDRRHADYQCRYAEIRLRDRRSYGCKVVTYALENQAVADYTAANITYDEFDHPSFDCICRGELRGRYTLMVPGLHNVSNALAAIALADELQLPENAPSTKACHLPRNRPPFPV